MKKTVVHIITPVITKGIRTLDDVTPFEREDLAIRHSLLDAGPSSIECEFDEALSVPDTVLKAIEAERSGADALIIDCMGDPGLNACREVVNIPVLGPGQASMHFAAMLGHRFSFVTVLDCLRPMIDDMVSKYGLKDSYASFESVNVPVLDIHEDMIKLQDAMLEKSLIAVKDKHAGAIVLGCTGFLGCAEAIKTGLLDQGLNVPVIDPIPLTLHLADSLVKTGLSHSKVIYPAPRDKELIGYSFPQLS